MGSGMKRFIVCGSRDYDDRAALYRALDHLVSLCGPFEVIHGDARGADRLAGKWAEDRDLKVTAVPADWKAHGKAAGPIRNREMLKYRPDAVIAFPGGSGTADMMKAADKEGVLVLEPYVPPRDEAPLPKRVLPPECPLDVQLGQMEAYSPPKFSGKIDRRFSKKLGVTRQRKLRSHGDG